MRARLLALSIACLAVSAGTAQADHELGHKTPVTFEAPVPCGIVLCIPSTCDERLVPMTYDDEVVLAPEGAGYLTFELFPVIDSDSFVCEFEDEHDSDGDPNEVLASGANILGETCDHVIGPGDQLPIGCYERSTLEVSAGARYVLRVYNVLDHSPIIGRYVFTTAVPPPDA